MLKRSDEAVVEYAQHAQHPCFGPLRWTVAKGVVVEGGAEQ